MTASIYWNPNQKDYIMNINMRLVDLPLPRHYLWQGDATAPDDAHQELINIFYIQRDITKK